MSPFYDGRLKKARPPMSPQSIWALLVRPARADGPGPPPGETGNTCSDWVSEPRAVVAPTGCIYTNGTFVGAVGQRP
jgi:hypothetical protein